MLEEEMNKLRPIPWAPMYLADAQGGIWSKHRARGYPAGSPPHRVKPKINPDGYGVLTICVDGVRYYRFVHVLVLEAFAGKRPFPEAEACHADGDPSHNNIENLYWGTHALNVADRERHGRTLRGDNHPSAKLTESTVKHIKLALADGATTGEIVRQYGINRGTVFFIRRGLQWAHV